MIKAIATIYVASTKILANATQNDDVCINLQADFVGMVSSVA